MDYISESNISTLFGSIQAQVQNPIRYLKSHTVRTQHLETSKVPPVLANSAKLRVFCAEILLQLTAFIYFYFYPPFGVTIKCGSIVFFIITFVEFPHSYPTPTL